MILRNTRYSSLTLAGKVAAGVGLLVVLARLLPRESFGVFSYALTVATIFGFVVDYGFNIKLLRDLVLRPADVRSAISRAVASKLLLSAGVFAATGLLGYLPSLTPLQYKCVLLLTSAQVVGSFGTVLLNPFKCTNRFEVETLYTGLDSLLTVALTAGVAVLLSDVLVIANAYFLAKVIALGLVARRYAVDYGWARVRKVDLVRELSDGFPYAIHVFVGNVYLNVDTLVLKEYVSLADVALYQAAMRLVIGAGMALTVMNSVLTPRLTELRHAAWPMFHRQVRQAVWILAIVGLAGLLALSAGAPVTVRMLFGAQYLELEGFLWIFGVILFLRFIGGVYGVLLTISDRQAVRAAGVAVTLAYIVALDLILIPKHGVLAAAYVLLSAHVFLTAVYVVFVWTEYGQLFLRRAGATAAPRRPVGVSAS